MRLQSPISPKCFDAPLRRGLDGRAGAASAPRDGHVPVQGGALSYREWGHGPDTVVLLHGISSAAASWDDCAPLLATEARVIAWNAPGYASSSALPQHQPLASHYAEQLASLLEALRIKRCLLVGHSLGAMMAVAYASLPGSAAYELLLISPAMGYGGPEPARPPEVVRQGRFAALQQKGIEGMAQALPSRLLTARATVAQRERVVSVARQLSEHGYRQAVEMLCGDAIQNYPAPKVPTRVFCGDQDVVTTPAQSEDYARYLGAPFGFIHDAGHACYIEQPLRVAALIRDRLKRAQGSQGKAS